MGVIKEDNFESAAVGFEVPAPWVTLAQSGGPNLIIRTDGPGGSKSVKNESGQWNWMDFSTFSASDFRQIVRCQQNEQVILGNRVTAHQATGARFPSNGYGAQFVVSVQLLTIVRFTVAAPALLACVIASTAFGSDNILEFSSEGNLHKIFIDGNLELSAMDATFASGSNSIGMFFAPADPSWIDDWVTRDFAAAGDGGDRRRGRRMS